MDHHDDIPFDMKAMQALSKEYGGSARIPVEELGRIGFSRLEEDSLVRILPTAKLGDIAAKITVESEAKQETLRLPFTILESTVYLSSEYGSTAPPEFVKRKIDDLLLDLEYDLGDEDEYPPTKHVLTTHGPHKIDTINSIEAYNLSYPLEVPDRLAGAISFRSFIDGVITNQDSSGGQSDLFLEISDGALAIAESTHISQQDAESMSENLTRLLSRLGDIDELEKDFAEAFNSAFTNTAVENQYASGFQTTAGVLSDIIAMKGFTDVADKMKMAHSLPELRQVIATSLKQNDVLNAAKVEEKQMKKARTTMTDEQDLFEFSRKLSELKASTKDTMQYLYGLQAYLNAPSVFRAAIKNRIGEVNELFYKKVETSQASLSLDARPDPDKDENPGEFSGDCTKDKPLPFKENIGLYNVKMYVEGEHRGNIYLLQAQTTEGETVWHLEAIQVPYQAIDAEKFPSTLIDTLNEAARKEKISCITMNREPHYISNFDYIGAAMLEHVGAINTHKIHYGSLEFDGDYEPEFDGETPDVVNVVFPNHSDKYSNFQGRQTEQYVVLRNIY